MIRKRKPADDLNIFNLVKTELLPYTLRNFPSLTFTVSDLRKRLQPGVTYVDTGHDGRPAGFIHCFAKDGDLWIDMLAVKRERQRKGTGTRLMAEAFRFAGQEKCRRCLLYVDQNNGQGKLFYRKLGFQPEYFDPTLRCDLYSRRF